MAWSIREYITREVHKHHKKPTENTVWKRRLSIASCAEAWHRQCPGKVPNANTPSYIIIIIITIIVLVLFFVLVLDLILVVA